MSDEKFQKVYAKLLKYREREDLTLRPTKYLREQVELLDGSIRPLQLRYYQVQAVLHLLSMRRFVLGDDCGLGKTLMSIAALCYGWEKTHDEKAIVLTTKSATSQWVSEFEKFTTGVTTFTAAGTKAKRHAAYAAWQANTGPSVLIVGYASFRNDISQVQHWENFTLITDEAAAYKNPASRTHQVVGYMAQRASKVWALTATLIKNNLMEGYGIYKVVCPDLFGNKMQFMYYYCLIEMQRVGGNRRVPVITGYLPDRVKEFRKEIDPYFLGRAKHTVASELPVLTMRNVEVSMSPEQAAKYNEALQGMLTVGSTWTQESLEALGKDALQTLAALAGISDLNHKDTATALMDEGSVSKETTILTQIIYCQQIVDHPSLVDCEGKSGKFDHLIDLLTEGDLAGEKVIIFTRFRKMVDLMMVGMAKNKTKSVRITGAESTGQRKASQDAFQKHDSGVDKIFITMAAGEAINLQAASTIVFYDSPWSAGDFLQILGRMIRIGSIHSRVQAIHLVAKNTIDERVQETLHKKMRLIDAVLGKRLKGESDDTVIEAKNEISDLYAALRADAQGLL